MNTWAVLLAAGASSRLSAQGLATPKQFLPLGQAPLYWSSAVTLARSPGVRGLVFVMPGSPDPDISSYQEEIRRLESLLPGHSLGVEWKIVQGGPRRQDSVRLGLSALPAGCTTVLVHDAARPFASASLVASITRALENGAAAVIPGIPVTDTIKEVGGPVQAGCGSGPETVSRTLRRDLLRAVQTPQGFQRALLQEAHEQAELQNWEVTDDASLMELAGYEVLVVAGEEANRKITTLADLALLQPEKDAHMPESFFCSGLGYDVHRYGGPRPLILGGVPIPGGISVQAHSDGDTLLHALIDALLGCIGGGDIGGLFPDSDPAFDDIPSGVLLAEVLKLCMRAGFSPGHVDITVIAQVPRIAPHRQAIAANVAKLLQLPPSRVNVKATTEEHLGFTGEKKGIKVMALVSGTIEPCRAFLDERGRGT